MEISALPADLQRAALIDPNGEVSWPDDHAARAIQALTQTGSRVLGLDIRFYFEDGTFYEIPWSSSESESTEAEAEALDALSELTRLNAPTMR